MIDFLFGYIIGDRVGTNRERKRTDENGQWWRGFFWISVLVLGTIFFIGSGCQAKVHDYSTCVQFSARTTTQCALDFPETAPSPIIG